MGKKTTALMRGTSQTMREQFDVCKFDGTPCATGNFERDPNAVGKFSHALRNVERLRHWFLNTVSPL